MAPKIADSGQPRRSGRTRGTTTTGTTNSPASLPLYVPVPQDAPPASKIVPRPAAWEPVNLKDKAEWDIGVPEYFDEVHEQLASLFDRRPKGWKTQKEPEAKGSEPSSNKPTPEDVARTHAYYGRLKVHKRNPDDNGWSDHASFDDTWHAQRLLGAGTFGRVGLWVRRNTNDEITDEMAIKEEDYAQESHWDKGVSEEAVINEFVNRGGIENIQRLRGFKGFDSPADNPVLKNRGEVGYVNRRWRYYFEYAPHGSLERLLARYRAWNRYLPESFLWHVFDGLAQVLVTFAETIPDPKEHKRNMLRAEDRLVHFDIKPDNIFLGYEQPFNGQEENYGGHRSNVYPMVKIGDFGVAAMTSDKDPHNPARRFWERGTKYYLPPEQTHYGMAFPVPPNGEAVPLQNELGHFIAIETREKAKPPQIRLTQPMNVWGVGKVMYDLATLSHRYDYAGISTQNYEEYKRWNNNAIENFRKNPFTASNDTKSRDDPSPSPYSNELMDLIEQCMKPAAKERIEARGIKAITERILSEYGSDGNLQMNEKVYFNGNEINDMPMGPENFHYHEGPKEVNPLRRTSWTDMDQLMDYTVDPDEPELQPPRWLDKLKAFKAAQKKRRAGALNQYWQDNCRIENGKVVFDAPTTADDSGPAPADDQDNNQAQPDTVTAVDPDQEPAEEEEQPPAKVTKPKALSAKAAGKQPATASNNGGNRNGNKKGAKDTTKPTKAATGAGVKKKPAPTKPAAKNAGKNPAAKAPATANTDNTSQAGPSAPSAPSAPPTRQRLSRNAKKDLSPGKYKT